MSPRAHRALSLWLPVVVWAAVIFALSAVANLNSGLGVWDLILRKLAHAGEYALLAALLLRAIGGIWPALVAAGAYAVSDEIHQHFIRGRVGAVRDVAVDVIGAVVGLIAYSWWLRRRD